MLEILFPLSVTLAIEVPIYLLLKWRDLKLFIVASVLNLILNPLMNYALYYIQAIIPNYYIALISLEIMTTLIESLVIFLFMRIKYWKVLLFAVAANSASLLVGYLLQPAYRTKITIIVLMVIFLSFFLFIEVLTILSFAKNNANRHTSDNAANGDNTEQNNN